MVAVGNTGGPSSVARGRLMARSVSLVGLSWGSRYPWVRRDDVCRVYNELFEGVRTGRMRPVISTVGLEDVSGALDDLAGRHTVGKIVAVVGEG